MEDKFPIFIALTNTPRQASHVLCANELPKITDTMKNLPMQKSSLRSVALLAALVSAPAMAPAAMLFFSDFDSSTGLTVLGSPDTSSQFGYDYSADGIPSAPNGSGTTGLRLEANNGDATAAAEQIAVVTTSTITAPLYRVSVDAWVNAVGPFPGGGAGSTEFGGMIIGHDGATVGRNGGSLLYTGEGGSSRDYRLYKDAGEQFLASGQYNVLSNNNSGAEFSAAFPGLAPPAAQGDATVTSNGIGGFQWMTLNALVDQTAGTATFSMTSAASGNTVSIGTLDAGVGSSFATSGSAGVAFADLFSSVSGNPALSFGVFDNLEVTSVPEPSSVLLLGLGALGLIRRRR
ncbi:MAG: hypothetical protein ACI9NQ_000698 [Paracoccaceae bacterium]